MMEYPKVSLSLPAGPVSANTMGNFSLKIDGHPIRGVRKVSIDSGYDRATILTIELIAEIVTDQIA